MAGVRVHDVAILGAGPVGMALACLLARSGMDCVICGPAPAVPASRRTDPRALALTPATRNLLAHCGAWPRLGPEACGEFRRMEVWDAEGTGRITFDSAELCLTTLGYIVNQGDLESALAATLAELGVVPMPAGEPAALQWQRECVRVDFSGSAPLRARLVVGADGARSRTRELAGIGFVARAYDQHALACTVHTALPHDCTARQRFLATGPLAFLPLADSHASGIVWSTTPEQARRLQLQDAAVFHAELATAFGHVLGDISASGQRVVFPLQRAQAERYCRERLVLAGDAAHCVHPLAGQGANLGLMDAAALAQLLLEARNAGRDPGALRTLRAYERWRRGDNGLMIAALDSLQKLFGAGAPPLRRLRNAGLDLCDALAPLKHRLMQHAMGIAGDVPALARAPQPCAGFG